MKVYLLKSETNEILEEHDNAAGFGERYIMFSNYGNIGRVYAPDGTYYTNAIPEPEPTEPQ